MASSSQAKKRKVDSECRLFKDSWTEKYLFISISGKPVCLVCKEDLAVNKEYNLKRHYETKHAVQFETFTGQLRKDKVNELQK